MRHLLRAAFIGLTLTVAGSAFADTTAQDYLKHEHERLSTLLRQPVSQDRDAKINQILANTIDYEELTKRAFGEPCPAEEPSCVNIWAELSDDQKNEVRGLFMKLVKKTYRNNLVKTLDYDITYRDTQDGQSQSKVRTEAKNKTNVRAPAVQVDYVVKPKGSAWTIVDILPERSSLTNNYRVQFERFWKDPAKKYPEIVKRLNHAIER